MLPNSESICWTKTEIFLWIVCRMLYAYVEQNRLSGEDCATVIYTITGLKDTGKGKLVRHPHTAELKS